MANVNINTGKANKAQFTVSYQKNGYGALIPVIDGVPHKELMMGYVSEADAEAGMKLLAEALKATGGDVRKAMEYMYTAAAVTANDINADEAVKINEIDFTIDYADKKIYRGEHEVANLDNITAALSNEAIKELLIDKVRTALDDPYWDDDEDDEFILHEENGVPVIDKMPNKYRGCVEDKPMMSSWMIDGREYERG